jgi:hypothetical protein
MQDIAVLMPEADMRAQKHGASGKLCNLSTNILLDDIVSDLEMGDG